MKKTYIEIDLDNLKYNINSIKNKFNDYDYYIAVIKANAYGHGEYIVNELVNNGINYVAVATLEEALNVRKYNKNISILCLEPIYDYATATKNNITLTITDLSYLKDAIQNINIKTKVHLKIDSGMNRLGIKDKNELKEIVDLINTNQYLILEGIYSHFATVGFFDPYYDKQVNNFKKITSLIDLNKIPMRHFSNSVILLSHAKLDFINTARFGTMLYGYNVAPIRYSSGIKNKLRILRDKYYQKKYHLSEVIFNNDIKLKPMMKMYTNILQIKEVRKGEIIGYGATYKAEENIKIAILPVGYNNGIGENINRYVLINGRKYYAVGSIGMNMMTIIIDDKVKLTDQVIVLGNEITLGTFSRFNNQSLATSLLNLGKNNIKVYTRGSKIEYQEENR